MPLRSRGERRALVVRQRGLNAAQDRIRHERTVGDQIANDYTPQEQERIRRLLSELPPDMTVYHKKKGINMRFSSLGDSGGLHAKTVLEAEVASDETEDSMRELDMCFGRMAMPSTIPNSALIEITRVVEIIIHLKGTLKFVSHLLVKFEGYHNPIAIAYPDSACTITQEDNCALEPDNNGVIETMIAMDSWTDEEGKAPKPWCRLLVFDLNLLRDTRRIAYQFDIVVVKKGNPNAYSMNTQVYQRDLAGPIPMIRSRMQNGGVGLRPMGVAVEFDKGFLHADIANAPKKKTPFMPIPHGPNDRALSARGSGFNRLTQISTPVTPTTLTMLSSYGGQSQQSAGEIARKLPSLPVGGPGGDPGGDGDTESEDNDGQNDDDDDAGDGGFCNPSGGSEDNTLDGRQSSASLGPFQFDDDNGGGNTPGSSTSGIDDFGDRAATQERIVRSLNAASPRHSSNNQILPTNEDETEAQRETASFSSDMERARQLSLRIDPPDNVKQETQDDNEHSMFVSPEPSSRAAGPATSARPPRLSQSASHLAHSPSFANSDVHSMQRRRALSHASSIDPPPGTSAAATAHPGSSSAKRRRLESTTQSSSSASRHTTPARNPTPSPLLRQATDTARRGSSILAPTLHPRRRSTSVAGGRVSVGPRGSVSRSTRHGSFQGPGHRLGGA
ncbi:uncharacterized protein AB675_6109 [Cyphellophora attinorum]|uniref:Uncharacterized protein n=1 Tax=Cyphellophora attinorum TaxID=1664694 RepID=A0A0N0NQN7_9EURO|nr:uncharacterized protein AB675_6109 [Phialophora attinorum]KPI44118.1 hypothetical protein AB675_6109 [Phialophora attinorum]